MSIETIMGELAKMHSEEQGWLFLPELRLGTGYGEMQEQRVDGWAIKAWEARGIRNLRRAFEVKVQESDLRKELRDPDKRWMAYAVSHEFYFVAPSGLVDPMLLAIEDGLIEWDGATMTITRRARVREGMPPRWDFVASLARRVRKETEVG